MASLLGRCDLVSSHDVVELLALPPLRRVVGLSGVVEVEVALDPLAELQVVLVLRLHQLVHLR